MSKLFWVMLLTAITGITLLPQLQAGASGARVHYVGGTGSSLIERSEVRIELTGDDDLLLDCKGASLRVPYGNITRWSMGRKSNAASSKR